MKKSEVKHSSSQQLIQYLISTAFLATVPQSKEMIAIVVCEELKSRGVIDDSTVLFEMWRG